MRPGCSPLTGCDWSNRDFFTARDTSQLITWQDGRCSSELLSSLPKPDSHLSVATGFGCATIFWYMKHRSAHTKNYPCRADCKTCFYDVKVKCKDVWFHCRPEFLEDFTVAGTIQDYVVSMLCGLDVCVMTPQNAASWGFFNTSSNQWNIDMYVKCFTSSFNNGFMWAWQSISWVRHINWSTNCMRNVVHHYKLTLSQLLCVTYITSYSVCACSSLRGAGFPLTLLPQCVPSGGLAGQTCSDWHGIPAGTPVGAALGDFQCSVYSCMSARTDAGERGSPVISLISHHS